MNGFLTLLTVLGIMFLFLGLGAIIAALSGEDTRRPVRVRVIVIVRRKYRR